MIRKLSRYSYISRSRLQLLFINYGAAILNTVRDVMTNSRKLRGHANLPAVTAFREPQSIATESD